MNLAGRLDRLRGRPAEVTPDTLARQLQRLDGRRTAKTASPPRIDTLAGALQLQVCGDALLLCERQYTLPRAQHPLDLTMLPEVHGLADPDWVYLDTETTGLSGGVGNLAFMVGVARYTDAQTLAVRQYLLGSFAAEAAMLRDLVSWVGRDAVLVSYNGKCFDLPLLGARCAMQRVEDGLGGLRHLDLMYTVRRAYRRHWPDCRLQTAEKRLLDLHRAGDLPGSEAPAAWQAWLRRGETVPLGGVLQHNFQDVASLALLHHGLLRDYAGHGEAPVDHAAIGRAWQQAGHEPLACKVLEAAGAHLDETGVLQLAASYRRRGEWARAEALWLQLHAGGSALAACELSKYYEHRRRDYRRAMDFAAVCETSERHARCGRLQEKIGSNLVLPLVPG